MRFHDNCQTFTFKSGTNLAVNECNIAAKVISYPNKKTKFSFMHTTKIEMTTLSQVLEKLRLKKQDNEFRMSAKGFGPGTGKFYEPNELKIIKTYRFEGESDPSDSCILYVLEANDGRMGYSLDAYGVYSNHDDDKYDDFIRKIPMEERDEQLIFGE